MDDEYTDRFPLYGVSATSNLLHLFPLEWLVNISIKDLGDAHKCLSVFSSSEVLSDISRCSNPWKSFYYDFTRLVKF